MSADGSIAMTAATERSLLRFLTCGSVDDGKSSLIGRLLFETGAAKDDQIEALAAESRRYGAQGGAIDYALLVDGLAAEREQGITIDLAYRYFATDRRAFIVADAPGHEQYTKNMATGASNADLALLLVDARKGLLPQTRRHSLIVSMLGVRHVIVAVNKMDLVGYSQAAFDAIAKDYHQFAKGLGFTEATLIPVSAVAGDNIVAASSNTPWYRGPTLLQHLETTSAGPRAVTGAFAMPVQSINRPTADFRGYSGMVVAGRVSPGDEVCAALSGQTARVARVVTFDGDLAHAEAGQSITLTLDREIDISRGDVLAAASFPPVVATEADACLIWMSRAPLDPMRAYLAKLGAASFSVRIALPSSVLNIESLADAPAHDVGLNAIFRAHLGFDRPVAVAPYGQSRDLGGFILIDRASNETVAMALIETVNAPAKAKPLVRSTLTLGPPRDSFRRSLIASALLVIGFALLTPLITGRASDWPALLILGLLSLGLERLGSRVRVSRAEVSGEGSDGDGI